MGKDDGEEMAGRRKERVTETYPIISPSSMVLITFPF
jgi:hypothetical protein